MTGDSNGHYRDTCRSSGEEREKVSPVPGEQLSLEAHVIGVQGHLGQELPSLCFSLGSFLQLLLFSKLCPQVFHTRQLNNIFNLKQLLYFFSFSTSIVDTVTDVPIIPSLTLPASTQSLHPLPSGHHHTVVCVCGLCTCVL